MLLWWRLNFRKVVWLTWTENYFPCKIQSYYFHLLSHVFSLALSVIFTPLETPGFVMLMLFNFPADRRHKGSLSLEGVTSIFPYGSQQPVKTFSFFISPLPLSASATLLLCPPPLPLSSRCSRGDSSSWRASGNRDEPAFPDSSDLF